MSDSSLSLQKGIYAALTADAALTQAISGVFDYVPEPNDLTTGLPWVQIGDDVLKDWNTMDFDGKAVTCTIHTWTREQSRSVCKTIQGMIQRILNGAALTAGAAIVVFFQLEFETTMRDPDGVTHHGIQRFRALIQEA